VLVSEQRGDFLRANSLQNKEFDVAKSALLDPRLGTFSKLPFDESLQIAGRCSDKPRKPSATIIGQPGKIIPILDRE